MRELTAITAEFELSKASKTTTLNSIRPTTPPGPLVGWEGKRHAIFPSVFRRDQQWPVLSLSILAAAIEPGLAMRYLGFR